MSVARQLCIVFKSWIIAAILLLSFAFAPANVEAAGTIFPDKTYTDYTLNIGSKQLFPVPLSVTGATYSQVINIDDSIATVTVQETPSPQYVVEPRRLGMTTVEYEWIHATGDRERHKFTITVTDPRVSNIPTIKVADRDEYVQLDAVEINALADMFNANWSNNVTQTQMYFEKGDRVFSRPRLDQTNPTKPYVSTAKVAEDDRAVFKVTTSVGTQRVTATYYKDYSVNTSPIHDSTKVERLNVSRDGNVNISLQSSGMFTDPDGDKLNFTVTASPSGIVQTELQGEILTVKSISTGTVQLEITARDGRGGDDVTGTMEIHAWMPSVAGIAGTYSEVNNVVEMQSARSGTYYLLRFSERLPDVAALERLAATGVARKATAGAAGDSVQLPIDKSQSFTNELAAGLYGVYHSDGSTVTLERVLELQSKEQLKAEILEEAKRRGKSKADITDARIWLLKQGNNDYIRAKFALLVSGE
ncbi:Ig-like domain-containing protein [Paenibacillus sp. 481]|uniref:Ig-like domain-containing protein n=1 Tax=Paenibacillus sp. 481 TaxID=2835869 RepID=UPI001E474BA1|nr:hypothetical protein [Paenibacillus sp. 481]UHA74753.1 hypothetical protein KIK04_06720 [Paenibacillus sp. 481]